MYQHFVDFLKGKTEVKGNREKDCDGRESNYTMRFQSDFRAVCMRFPEISWIKDSLKI